MNKTSRKLYVTTDEHVAIQRIVTEYNDAILRLVVGAEDEYVDELVELLEVDRSILLEHIWEIEDVDTVVTRLGFDWTNRRDRGRGFYRGR